MSRSSPRYVPAGSLVEITARTIAGRFLLVPSKELNAGILAVIGRALSLYPIELHAVSFMSNHWHGLVSIADAQALGRFVQYVHANVAGLVRRLHGWEGRVFTKAAYIVVGPTSEEARLRYVLSQGVKEGLVRRCVEWPGVHSARPLLLEEAWVGRWEDRRAARTLRAGGGRSGGREPLRGEIETAYPIDLAPLPSWRHLDTAERVARVKRIVCEIEASARLTFPSVLGADAVLACDPMTKGDPETESGPIRRRAPFIHTSDVEERTRFANERSELWAMFAAARSRLRSGQLASLPPDCYSPIVPFCGTSVLLWALGAAQERRRAPKTRRSSEPRTAKSIACS